MFSQSFPTCFDQIIFHLTNFSQWTFNWSSSHMTIPPQTCFYHLFLSNFLASPSSKTDSFIIFQFLYFHTSTSAASSPLHLFSCSYWHFTNHNKTSLSRKFPFEFGQFEIKTNAWSILWYHPPILKSYVWLLHQKNRYLHQNHRCSFF